MNISTIEYLDAPGAVQCVEPMRFSRLFAIGDEICEKGAWFRVKEVEVKGDVQQVIVEAVAAEAPNQPL